MDKIKNFVPMLAFCLLFCKGLVLGYSTTDVYSLLIIGSLFIAFEFRVQNKKVSELELKLKNLDEATARAYKKAEDVHTHINSMKLSQQFRPNAAR